MPVVYRPRLRVLIDPVYEPLICAKILFAGPDDCWSWIGAGDRYPVYTVTRPERKTLSVHVIVLEGKLGRKLRPGFQACHTCDYTKCVNPDHLYEGTQQDNMRDKHSRGRHPTRCRTRWLADNDVRRIRVLAGLISQYEIARRFNISRSVVQGIIEFRKYKDVA